MKTEDLIGLLATSAGPAPRAVAARRLVPAMALGLLASAALALAVIGLVPHEVFLHPGWWIKVSYAAAVALGAGWLAARLARPASPAGAAWAAVAAVVLVMALLGTWQWAASEPSQRLRMWLGHSSSSCPVNVLLLSLPALALALRALRGLAPTRPRLAGLAAGLLAGGVGATGYALTCTEVAMPFVATWYSLGIALPGALGALLGPRLLRW